MTLQELNLLFDTISERKKIEETRITLLAAAHPRAQSFDGMPHAPGVKDKVGNLGVELAYIDEELVSVDAKIDRLIPPVEDFISNIKDIQLRMIFRFRYLHGMEWKEVAGMLGGENTEDGVKSAVYRFLRSAREPGKRIPPSQKS